MEYEVGRLLFTQSQDEPDAWWAVDESNVEYKVHLENGTWQTLVQRRVGWNSESCSVGAFDTFDDAVLACSNFDTAGFGL